MVVSDDSVSVREVLDRFCRGWESADADAVLDCFEQSPLTTVVGTDAGEEWHGFSALEAPFRAMTAAFGEASYSWAPEPRISVDGDLALADGRLDTQLVADGAPIAASMRTTWTLRRTDGVWRVVQAHFSIPAADPVAPY